uniref:Uncharacterized protein n=1 Tax=Rhabditophanes sp. KR3021 TaxID=114890 RepID=A0AC35U5L7_9BILA
MGNEVTEFLRRIVAFVVFTLGDIDVKKETGPDLVLDLSKFADVNFIVRVVVEEGGKVKVVVRSDIVEVLVECGFSVVVIKGVVRVIADFKVVVKIMVVVCLEVVVLGIVAMGGRVVVVVVELAINVGRRRDVVFSVVAVCEKSFKGSGVVLSMLAVLVVDMGSVVLGVDEVTVVEGKDVAIPKVVVKGI